MLCLLFWAGSQRAVVVHCCFSSHASPSFFRPRTKPNPHTQPLSCPTPTLNSNLPAQAWIRASVRLRSPRHSLLHIHVQTALCSLFNHLICDCICWSKCLSALINLYHSLCERVCVSLHCTHTVPIGLVMSQRGETGGVMRRMWDDMTAQVCPPDIIDGHWLLERKLKLPNTLVFSLCYTIKGLVHQNVICTIEITFGLDVKHCCSFILVHARMEVFFRTDSWSHTDRLHCMTNDSVASFR